jgi:hypothetical protein
MEYNVKRHGVCGRPLDEHGQCDRASDHGDHLADRDQPIRDGRQLALEVDRLRKALATPKGSDDRRVASTLDALRRMRPKP